ncbi:MAG: cupin domain-containing protein [Candidatus Bathyarchaeia archaeon]
MAHYIDSVSFITVPAGRRLPFHRENAEGILYVLQGRGRLNANGSVHDVEPRDAVYLPPGMPYSVEPAIEGQHLLFVQYQVAVPLDSTRVEATKAAENERSEAKPLVRNWMDAAPKPGHEGTCLTYPVFSRDSMRFFLFATMMTVPSVLSYHRHNSESVYMVESGLGTVKVAGEEEELQALDAVYMPPEVAHGCSNALPDQPLNVFCVGVAVPHDAQVWSIDGLPET